MTNGIERPLDLLNDSKGKEVLVHLKGDKQFVGTLLAFDIHINLVLDNTKEMQDNKCGVLVEARVPGEGSVALHFRFASQLNCLNKCPGKDEVACCIDVYPVSCQDHGC